MSDSRNASIDLLKTISIIGVVFIHSAWLFGNTPDVFIYIAKLFRFCVPCFIIIWAYFYERGYASKDLKERGRYAIAKLGQLIIVFGFWSTIYFLINVDLETLTAKNLVTRYWSGYGWAGQYFFIILIQILLLFPWIRKSYSIRWLRLLIIFIGILIYVAYAFLYDLLPDLIIKLGNRPFIYWILYVYLGIYLQNNRHLRFPFWYVFTIVLIPIGSGVLEYLGLLDSGYITPFVLISACLFSLPFMTGIIDFPRPVRKFVELVGSNTMIIFVANPLVGLFLRSYDYKGMGITDENCRLIQLMLPWCSTGLVLMITLILSVMIKRSRLIRMLGGY